MNQVMIEHERAPQFNLLPSQPLSNEDAVIKGDYYRFTVLTPELIRMEYSETGFFEDRATQTVLNRNLPTPEFNCVDKEQSLEIRTSRLHLTYDKKPFSRHGLNVQVRNSSGYLISVWNYGDVPSNLGGTARTLDNADGVIPLEDGLLSRAGYTLLDDSTALLLEEDGRVESRSKNSLDLYFFGYGHDYIRCLQSFYQLSGATPLLPRYALGNWWSRYYPYSADEYKDLINRFNEEQIPFSVAVLDMDWHLVDVDPQYGTGWTGYTWNRELFPNPPKFLEWLHEQGLRVTLNVHPADGVRAYEEQYLAVAKEMGKDTGLGETIPFDITDPKFLSAYFKHLHHPLEDEGVDFWWIDWQQGGVTKIPGLDPLWMLNHYHYLDSGRRGQRQMTFSRYAGLGSHRYPIGFSGDTIVSWESLAFQPYFTATASNAGYGWWSHDIGGHMEGCLDDEMAVRWVQLGVFSPILRLHSTSSPFNSKEPWRFNKIAEAVMKDCLLLRHRLIPYLYTMNRYASYEGIPLITPMYYHHSESNEAYEVPNEYYFGTELVVCPITKPMDRNVQVAEFKAWLPEGLWIDFFDGRVYDGGRRLSLYRSMEGIPVLAKAGAIVPMADLTTYTCSTANPIHMEVRVFAGADGHFQLWEDEGNTATYINENWCNTEMLLKWEKETTFTIFAARGNTAVIPDNRSWKLSFVGFTGTDVKLYVGDHRVDAITSYTPDTLTLTVEAPNVSVHEDITVFFTHMELGKRDFNTEVFSLLNRAQIRFQLKAQVYELVKKAATPWAALASLASMDLEPVLFSAISEILTSRLR